MECGPFGDPFGGPTTFSQEPPETIGSMSYLHDDS